MEQISTPRNTTSFIYLLINILLFLTSLNFLNAFNYFAVILVIIILIKTISFNIKVPITKNLILLFLFYIFYTMFSYQEISDYLYFIKILLYFFLYFVGLIITSGFKDEKAITQFILVMAFGAAFHGILNFIINYQSFSSTTFSGRNMPDIWTGKVIAATGMNTVFVLFIGVLFYLFFIQHNKILLGLSTITFIVMIYFNIMNASRTIFVITALTVLLCLTCSIFISKKKTKKIYITIIMTIIILLFIYYENLFGFGSFLNHSPLFNRFNTSENYLEDGRLSLQICYLKYLFDYPFGGHYIFSQVGNYAHNILLDAIDTAGIFPAIFLFFFLFTSIMNMIRMTRNQKVPCDFKLLIIGVFVSVILQFNIEPILEGSPWLFALFCLIAGMVDKYTYSLKEYPNSTGGDFV